MIGWVLSLGMALAEAPGAVDGVVFTLDWRDGVATVQVDERHALTIDGERVQGVAFRVTERLSVEHDGAALVVQREDVHIQPVDRGAPEDPLPALQAFGDLIQRHATTRYRVDPLPGGDDVRVRLVDPEAHRETVGPPLEAVRADLGRVLAGQAGRAHLVDTAQRRVDPDQAVAVAERALQAAWSEGLVSWHGAVLEHDTWHEQAAPEQGWTRRMRAVRQPCPDGADCVLLTVEETRAVDPSTAADRVRLRQPRRFDGDELQVTSWTVSRTRTLLGPPERLQPWRTTEATTHTWSGTRDGAPVEVRLLDEAVTQSTWTWEGSP